MVQVKKYLAEVISIIDYSDSLFSIGLKAIDKSFKFLPGQFLHLALDEYDPSGFWPESRCFSIQSAPCHDTIEITYSVRGSFTKRMRTELTLGKKVVLKLPYGNLFTQQHVKVNTVFIAGGTGMTPFISLFDDVSFTEYQNPILYAGFRKKELNIYSEKLKKAIKNNPGFQIFEYYETSDGILDIGKILSESDKKTSFFISGPPSMIKSFRVFLLSNGLSGAQIKTDDWE